MSHRVELQIPFTGFYHSLHSAAFGNAEEQDFDHLAECLNQDVPEWLCDLQRDTADYTNAHFEYAKAYATAFCAEYLDGGRFSGFTSPREYNFETDRVFVEVPLSTVIELHLKTPQDILNRLAAERHTSRDGFASSYSPEVDTWGPVDTWDHNQLMTLLIAYLENERGEEWDMWAEHELTEDFGCNGELQEWLYPDSPETSRYWKIFNYIVGRSERTIRTAYPQLSETLRDLDAPQLSNLCQSIIDLKS